jgi:hypothetical protein
MLPRISGRPESATTGDNRGVAPDSTDSQTSTPLDGPASDLFRKLRPLLHSVLVIHYRFTEENARDAEGDLQVWVDRLARRGVPTASRLREALIVAACEYARSAQLWRLDGKASGDARFDRFLARDPREVADEIIRRTGDAAPP